QAARDGDPASVSAFEQVGYWLGNSMADLVQIVDPQVILVGGGVVDAGELLLAPTRVGFAEALYARGKLPHAEVYGAQLGSFAGGGQPALGNAVLTNLRVHAREQWCVQYPLTPGRHMRGAAFVRCAVGRSEFVVSGSHLATDPGERPGQAVILKKVLADLDAPVILGLDLNENPGGPAWRTVADGLVDAGGSLTFPATRPQHRIDAIFVDPRCSVLSCRVVDSAAARAASDHLPVIAEIALPAV